LAPSRTGINPIYLNRAKAMTEGEIKEAIAAHAEAAGRAAEAGADGVHIAASGGYLLNEFLSPFFNRRQDAWGGSDEKRFRMMREVIQEVRKNVPEHMAVSVKLTANDYTPRPGLTTPLAAKYAGWMADLGIDALEIASGCTTYSGWKIWRGGVPVKELVSELPTWQKPAAWLTFKRMVGKFDFEEGYNLEDAKVIKPAIGRPAAALTHGGDGGEGLRGLHRPFPPPHPGASAGKEVQGRHGGGIHRYIMQQVLRRHSARPPRRLQRLMAALSS